MASVHSLQEQRWTVCLPALKPQPRSIHHLSHSWSPLCFSIRAFENRQKMDRDPSKLSRRCFCSQSVGQKIFLSSNWIIFSQDTEKNLFLRSIFSLKILYSIPYVPSKMLPKLGISQIQEKPFLYWTCQFHILSWKSPLCFCSCSTAAGAVGWFHFPGLVFLPEHHTTNSHVLAHSYRWTFLSASGF